MILYIYKNNFCDPANGIGEARKFEHADDIDDYLSAVCLNMTPIDIKNHRAFVTNDEVGWDEIDHWVLFKEALNQGIRQEGRIKEIDLMEQVALTNKRIDTFLSKLKGHQDIKDKINLKLISMGLRKP